MKQNTLTYRKYLLLSFALGAALFIIPALSFILQNGFPFIYYGDFNAQQIPFTLSIHKDMRELSIPEYDFNAGTGLDYIGAYGFYNLFSPYTLLYAIIPEGALLYTMPFMIMLKMGVCSVCAFIYISRFCKNSDYAVAGALIYTFSGYQMVNFLFHYMDAISFFPLLLASLEAAVTEKKRGYFGAAAALCAFTNYYIFGIEVIFLILYFIIRLTDKSFRINIKDFFCLAAESLLGALAAGIVLFPALECLLENPRFSSSFESVSDMFLYETPWRYARILQAIFIPPDIQGYTNFFPDFEGGYPNGSRWSSQSLYLPLFGASGVIAYIIKNKKSWSSRLVMCCVIFAFIPVLNSAFSMGNALYYARWMFAPTLIMALMTACALDECTEEFKYGLAASGIFTAALTVFTLVLPMEKLSLWKAGAYYSDPQKWSQIAISLLGTAAGVLIIFKLKRDETYSQKVLAVTAAFVFLFSEANLLFGIGEERYPDMVQASYKNYPSEQFDDNYGSRAAATEFYDNINLIFDKMSIDSFNSTVNPYVMRYCELLGMEKQDISKDFASCCLCSAKVLITQKNKSQSLQPGFSEKFQYIESYEKYMIFENPCFIPIGFCYDYCISEDDLLTLDTEARSEFMLKAMVVEDTNAVSDYLLATDNSEITALSDEEFEAECKKRAAVSAYSFKTDGDSCTAEITVGKPELVFFSIAYDEDFTAYVDGKETEIINANIGFMAVPVSEGTHTVELVYNSTARNIGTVSTISGTLLLAIYCTCLNFRKIKPLKK